MKSGETYNSRLEAREIALLALGCTAKEKLKPICMELGPTCSRSWTS
jgi:hypothetical protein